MSILLKLDSEKIRMLIKTFEGLDKTRDENDVVVIQLKDILVFIFYILIKYFLYFRQHLV